MQINLVLVIAVALVVIAFTGCTANASELINPDYEYELDTWGFNSEVYEFTPKSNRDLFCIAFMLDNLTAVGLQCHPKTEE